MNFHKATHVQYMSLIYFLKNTHKLYDVEETQEQSVELSPKREKER